MSKTKIETMGTARAMGFMGRRKGKGVVAGRRSPTDFASGSAVNPLFESMITEIDMVS